MLDYAKRVFFVDQTIGFGSAHHGLPNLIMSTLPLVDDNGDWLMEGHPCQRDLQMDTVDKHVPLRQARSINDPSEV